MMKSTLIQIFILVTLGILFGLSACSTPAGENPADSQPADLDSTNLISATGKVIPEQEALLSMSTGGVVEAVFVKKGQVVTAGEVLVQLEGTEQQAAIISSAELALVNAQIALEKLYKETNLLAAEALRSAEVAEKALDDLNHTEGEEALAIRNVADAQRRLEDADRNLVTLTNAPTQDAIDQAYVNLLLAEKKLKNTLEDVADLEWQLKKYSGIIPVAKRLRQALKGLEIQRTQDQLAFERAQTKYHDLQNPPDATDVAVAEAEYLAAQAALSQAQRDLERIQDGPEAGDVAVLEAQIEKGYRDFETYNAGPDPDEVTLAEARVANAEAQLVAAQEIFADLELLAPFDGVVSEVYLNPNEWLTPGMPVLLLADLDNLQVETTDLSEIDIAKIKVGDTAVITFDALPELVLEGTVVRIAPKADTGAGVNYPVVLALGDIPTDLRWGMTAFVDMEVDK